jgi:hypothetical protein
VEDELRKLSVRSPLTSFVEHGYDVIGKIRTYLSRARSTKSEIVKANNLWLCDTALQWLLLQYGRFRIVEREVQNVRWMALNNLVGSYVSKLKLPSIPLPLLGDSYFATGSFQYYRKLALRLGKEYYLVSVDGSDAPVFWPLLLHELSHCWLSSRDFVDLICGAHSSEITGLNLEIVESKVEEALCDALATRLVGPAYPFAYFNKLWAQFPYELGSGYPSHEFRIECMSRVLEEQNLQESAEEMRNMTHDRFVRSWENEDIAWCINDLVETTRELPDLVSSDIYENARKSLGTVESATIEDMPTLFLFCWMLLDGAAADEIRSVMDKTSKVILTTLNG